MAKFHNPALKEESRYEPARIIPLRESESILDWLKYTDRLFKLHEPHRFNDNNVPEELEDIIVESISDLGEEE
jgi:Protein of unknown function (DUF3134)